MILSLGPGNGILLGVLLEINMNMKNKILKLITLLLIFIIGAVLGYLFSRNNIQECSFIDPSDTYEVGWQEAQRRYYNSGENILKTDVSVTVIAGKVIGIDNKTFSFEITKFDPLSDPELDIRNVTIKKDTVIKKYIYKEASVYNAELEKYRQEVKQDSLNEDLVSPSEQSLVMTDVSDLMIGTEMSVLSKSNIRNEKSFTAQEVIILRQ